LLLHGYQKPNSLAAKALIALKKQGIGVYNKETKKSHANQKAVKIYVPVLSVKSVSAMKFNQTYAN
jgi:hypothetical protein